MRIAPKDTFRKRFIAVESDSLVIETIQTESKSFEQGLSPKGTVPNTHLRILKLKGTWRANKQNELVFDVNMRKGPPEAYTFKGAWKINKNQQIEYVCGAGPDVLTYKGHWDISSANRLVYILEGSSTSRFEFKVQLESSTFYPKEGQIRYRIGIGARKSRLTIPDHIFVLYGEWKFSRSLGLIFEMEYIKGEFHSLEFGAEVNFSKSNQAVFKLKSKDGKDLGIEVIFTHKFMSKFDAKAFVRLKAAQKESGVETGVEVPF
ncbi:MAG: hypothetical protein MUC39_06680 [Candidatus Omnitrophica bacterium]|jgi:hypothetical protein|nr:hypothetical protein [Candidatus Omnitrophota bacterium]